MEDIAISVRNATRADIPRLCAFQQNMALETEGKRLDADVLAAGTSAVFDEPRKGFYIVAQTDGQVVGSLLITYEWSDWRAATFLWIQSVYVDAAWRRRASIARSTPTSSRWPRPARTCAASVSTWSAKTPSPSAPTTASA